MNNNPILELMKAFLTIAVMAAATMLVIGAFIGCTNTPSGVRVVASSATYTNIGDINWSEYKIPVLSVYLGPKATVWVNKDYTALKEIEVFGCVTNDTAALGIYDSKEDKTIKMKMKFDNIASTNDTKGIR